MDKIERTLLSIVLILLTILLLYNTQHTITHRRAVEQNGKAIIELRQEIKSLQEDIDTFTRQWSFGEFEATAYAPLDPAAVKGMCHDGNPYSTATGTVPTAGRTIAVDPKVIPLGTRVYIQGKFYIAEDVGGSIKGQRIDICVETRDIALSWGRRQVLVRWRG
jgi:3D (Asp-Asp-Asp) domain-containing protein